MQGNPGPETRPLRWLVAATLALAACHDGRGGAGEREAPDPVAAGPRHCPRPQYSTECSEVEYFQCGFESTCRDGVITVTWHQHVVCEDGMDEIAEFQCTHRCPGACKPKLEWTAGRFVGRLGCVNEGPGDTTGAPSEDAVTAGEPDG